jgi:hypothetical protein
MPGKTWSIRSAADVLSQQNSVQLKKVWLLSERLRFAPPVGTTKYSRQYSGGIRQQAIKRDYVRFWKFNFRPSDRLADC